MKMSDYLADQEKKKARQEDPEYKKRYELSRETADAVIAALKNEEGFEFVHTDTDVDEGKFSIEGYLGNLSPPQHATVGCDVECHFLGGKVSMITVRMSYVPSDFSALGQGALTAVGIQDDKQYDVTEEVGYSELLYDVAKLFWETLVDLMKKDPEKIVSGIGKLGPSEQAKVIEMFGPQAVLWMKDLHPSLKDKHGHIRGLSDVGVL